MSLTKNHPKILMLLVLIFGWVVGVAMASPTPVTITKEVPKEVIKEVPADLTDWKALKEVDDTGFGYCVESADLSSQGFDAVTNGDIAKLQGIVTKVENLNTRINDLAKVRQGILSKLGY